MHEVSSFCAMKLMGGSHRRFRCGSLSLSTAGPIEAVLFDIDGTLCDSDPLHFEAFRDLLQQIGFQGGAPIDEEFFIKNISGKHNEDISGVLFPDWDHQKALQFMDDKEVLFRRLATERLVPVNGLHKLCKWIEHKGLRRAAVTNAPRPNAELMISILGLSEFFEYLIIGGECERAKPYPDPYLTALKSLGVSPEKAIILEDSASGIKAGVAAGVPVIGITTRNPDQLLLDAGASLLIKDFDDPKLWSALEVQEAKVCS
ncbi:unnamed protein product [Victoria cruziana]